MTIKIEKNVPLPKSPRLYPWDEMQVGDSFFVPDVRIAPMSAQASVAGRRYGVKFSCKTVEGGVRVWRIE